MASNTENLGLLKKNPSTDGADTFNIQTMLNDNWDKLDANAGTVAQTLANILKPTTPPIIGLPPSTTPDGMFQALGNTGELHVWRKTVVVGSKGYYLDTVSSGQLCIVNSSAYVVTFSYSDTVSAEGVLSGTVNTVSLSGTSDQTNKLSVLRGKFCRAESNGSSNSVFKGIIYIPNDATFTYQIDNGDYRSHHVNKKQTVVFTDAPITTTYPVSTNPNAYQEGDDAKAAGYTLGEVENNVQILSGGDNWPTTLYYADSVDVDNEGQLSLQSPNQYTFTTSSQYQNVSTLAVGRFIKIVPEASSGFSFRDGIWFVPSDATVTVSNYKIYASKIQKVTGYAAIPAGTTIEYLGKLGDKARVQVLSYVGTGTYGSSNPNSLMFDFAPKVVIVNGHRAMVSYTSIYSIILSPQSGDGVSMLGTDRGYVDWVICEATDRTVSWYAADYEKQLNESGMKYVAVAIG